MVNAIIVGFLTIGMSAVVGVPLDALSNLSVGYFLGIFNYWYQT